MEGLLSTGPTPSSLLSTKIQEVEVEVEVEVTCNYVYSSVCLLQYAVKFSQCGAVVCRRVQ